MPSRRVDVFFYGLFMDPDLLTRQGVWHPKARRLPRSKDSRCESASARRWCRYAAKLRAVAERVGLPLEYVRSLQ